MMQVGNGLPGFPIDERACGASSPFHRLQGIRRIALQSGATRVIDVVTAVITAKGENMIANTEQTETATASVAAEPKATKNARGAKRGAHVAPKKSKPGKKATPAKKAPQTPKAPKGEKKGGAA